MMAMSAQAQFISFPDFGKNIKMCSDPEIGLRGLSVGDEGYVTFEVTNQGDSIYVGPIFLRIVEREHSFQVMAVKNLPLSDFHSFAEFANGISTFDDDTKRAIIGNIKYDGKAFSWQIYIDAVFNNFDKLTDGFDADDFIDKKIEVPTVFIRALDSEFLPSSDYKAAKYIFPNSEIVEIPDCTHRIHFEKPKLLAEEISKYLLR